MNRFRQLLRQSSFHAFLFGVAAVLLSWPILAVAGRMGFNGLCGYLFLLWGALVLLLYFIGRSLGNRDRGGSSTDEEEGGPDV